MFNRRDWPATRHRFLETIQHLRDHYGHPILPLDSPPGFCPVTRSLLYHAQFCDTDSRLDLLLFPGSVQYGWVCFPANATSSSPLPIIFLPPETSGRGVAARGHLNLHTPVLTHKLALLLSFLSIFYDYGLDSLEKDKLQSGMLFDVWSKPATNVNPTSDVLFTQEIDDYLPGFNPSKVNCSGIRCVELGVIWNC